MGFILFAAKNIFRSKLRLIFTLILLTLGIMAVNFSAPSLLSLFPLNKETMGGADFSISNMNSNSNYTFSSEELNKIKSIPGVTEATGTLIVGGDVCINLSDSVLTSSVSLIGFNGVNLVNNSLIPGVGNIELIKGRLINEKSYEIIITHSYSENQHLDVGDNVTIYCPTSLKQQHQNISPEDKSNHVTFTVVGITANSLNNGNKFREKVPQLDGIISLDVANELIYNSSDLKFDFINVKTEPKQLDQVKNTIKQSNPNYKIWDNSSNAISESPWQIILLSLFVGGLLLLVATLKGIIERIREIGVLKALGWSNKRIVGMLFMETTIQTVIAWTIVSVIIVIPYLTIEPNMGFSLFINEFFHIASILVLTLVFSLVMPIIGILLPVLYVVRLKPTEALKYE